MQVAGGGKPRGRWSEENKTLANGIRLAGSSMTTLYSFPTWPEGQITLGSDP